MEKQYNSTYYIKTSEINSTEKNPANCEYLNFLRSRMKYWESSSHCTLLKMFNKLPLFLLYKNRCKEWFVTSIINRFQTKKIIRDFWILIHSHMKRAPKFKKKSVLLNGKTYWWTSFWMTSYRHRHWIFKDFDFL